MHPFLQLFFEGLNYLKEEKFINYNVQRKAVLLSQYLVNGETENPEHILLLNKIICGFPLEQSIELKLKLLKEEKEESENLLKAILKHWSALKSTSVKGLRESFLERDGKITDKDEYWLLQVEQKSYDVLLSFLPWSISIIKLPWMEKRIVVQWNS